MKTVYPDEKNVVLNENSVERKPCINREIQSNEITIKLYSCHDINMKFLAVVTPPSIYQYGVGSYNYRGDVEGPGGAVRRRPGRERGGKTHG